MSWMFFTKTTNSSPPKREIIASSQNEFFKTFATSTNAWSPAKCPKESLRFLKLSRSINKKTACCPWGTSCKYSLICVLQ